MRKASLFLVASDHAGFALKAVLLEHLRRADVLHRDYGCFSESESVDYPDFANKLLADMRPDGTEATLSAPASPASEPRVFSPQVFSNRGVLICGTGLGMSIAANRVSGVRAALCRTVQDVCLARAHNDANILVLGGRMTPPGEAVRLLEAFMATPFEGGRHALRVQKLDGRP